MVNFVTYRNGGGRIEGRIKAAVGAFYTSRGVLPEAVIVNAREVDAARVAVEVLGLRLPIQTMGGCLLPEVWLEVATC